MKNASRMKLIKQIRVASDPVLAQDIATMGFVPCIRCACRRWTREKELAGDLIMFCTRGNRVDMANAEGKPTDTGVGLYHNQDDWICGDFVYEL